jgi:hypothetical protein
MSAAVETVFVEGRFAGPPGAGNGGYVGGLLAERIGCDAEITLRRPTPVDRPLALRHPTDPGGPFRLEADGEILVEARAAAPDVAIPRAPTFAEACAASEAFCDHPHPFPRCFVCGPARAAGDGLRLRPGPLADGRVAAPWVPDASLTDASDRVAARFVWAALDCPGAYAATGCAIRPILLARITGRIDGSVRGGERCVVAGWRIGGEGRKHDVATALFDPRGRVVGRTRQLWVEPRRDAAPV